MHLFFTGLCLGLVACRDADSRINEPAKAQPNQLSVASEKSALLVPLNTVTIGPTLSTAADPFRLRKQLRSSAANQQIAGSLAVLSAPDKYTPNSLRLALSTAAKTGELKLCPLMAAIVSSGQRDVTTRAHAASALGLMGRNLLQSAQPKPLPQECAVVLSKCLTDIAYPPVIRRTCAEAIGLSLLEDYSSNLQASISNADENPSVQLMAARSLSRLQKRPVIKPEMVARSKLLPLPDDE